jgi:hypothetical protein
VTGLASVGGFWPFSGFAGLARRGFLPVAIEPPVQCQRKEQRRKKEREEKKSSGKKSRREEEEKRRIRGFTSSC